MARKISMLAPDWWDYTTLDDEILNDAAELTAEDLQAMSREGFQVKFYDTVEDFYLAEALEYIDAWKQATADNPVGMCGPAGPVEQLPLVARLVNEFGIDLTNAHFWAMDEWYIDGKEVDETYSLSFAKVDLDGCFNKIDKKFKMPKENIHFPKANVDEYINSWNNVRCTVMQGGQGEIKHWAFNDPLRREGKYKDAPPSPDEYRKLTTRIVELHPVTLMQNARTSGGGAVASVPVKALTVGPDETWKSEKVSIWHGGMHDNPYGIRLTTLMISKKIADSSVPMSLLADHPNVQFNFYRPAIGTCKVKVN
ncbi:glucosamine-6-phosphate isomerase [bacterium]|nr:glucosamine-6-phosphate isomerase [bacterium]